MRSAALGVLAVGLALAPAALADDAAEAQPLREAADDAGEAPPEADPILVDVTGDRAPPGSASFGRREIREMPGVLGDPYRAIEVQPSVIPAASGVPYYFIRGAPPGNVTYAFDGIQVPLLFHVGAGPSVIPPGIVQRVELHLGPLPADLGRSAGAIVEAESTPPRAEWRGEGSFRTIDIGGLLEAPLGEEASALVGGHYSVGTAILSALVPSIDVNYADYQARVSTKAGRGRLSVLGFGAYDYLATIDEQGALGPRTPDGEVRDVLIDSDFHRVDVRYEEDLRGGGKALAGMTVGLDRSRGIGVDAANDFKIAARAVLQKPVAERMLVRAGFEAAMDGYDITPSDNPCENGCSLGGPLGGSQIEIAQAFRELFPSRIDLALGGFVDAVIAIDDRSTITPGIRLDHYTSLGESALAIDPRLVGKLGIGDHVKLIPAIGMASQLPGFAPIPALQIGGIPGGLQRSLQSSFGTEVTIAPLDLRATVFRQAMFNLTDAIGTGRGAGFGTERFLSRTLGEAYGLELSAKGALARNVFFLASYTLSRSTREKEGRVVPSAYDRTHVLQTALLFDLGRNWRAGFRYVFYTGFPADESGPDRLPSESPDRTKAFFRLDARLSKRWVFDGGAFVGLVFDMQNATLSREVFDVTCDEKACTPRLIGPITIPTIAFETGF